MKRILLTTCALLIAGAALADQEPSGLPEVPSQTGLQKVFEREEPVRNTSPAIQLGRPARFESAAKVLHLDPAFAWLLAFAFEGTKVDTQKREIITAFRGRMTSSLYETRWTCESAVKARITGARRAETWCSQTPLRAPASLTIRMPLTVHFVGERSFVVGSLTSQGGDKFLFGDAWPTEGPIWMPNALQVAATDITASGTIQSNGHVYMNVWFKSKMRCHEVLQGVGQRLRDFRFEIFGNESLLEGNIFDSKRMSQEHLRLECAVENGDEYYAMTLWSTARK